MDKVPLLILTLALAFMCFKCESAPQNDTHALTQFRLQTDAHASLLTNWTGADACAAASTWRGVECSPNGRVVALSLPSLNLRGPIHSLSLLSYLRFLDLHDNRLNGTVSTLCNCTDLELLYLSGNDFSGEVPLEISSLRLLVRLDISDNNLRGPVPKEISSLTHLLTLRLQNNALSGEVPDFSSSLVNLKELNITNNELVGHLPNSMLNRFGIASFAGNGALCGDSPLPKCSSTETPSPSSSSDNKTGPSNPSVIPKTSSVVAVPKNPPSRKGLSPGVIVAIVVAVCVVFLVVVSFTVAHCCTGGRTSNSMVGSESGKRKSESSYGVYASGSGAERDSDGTVDTERSRLVFFDRRSQFELEDLLRASAEMLGKGSLGTVYRAVLDDGCTVAVKRLKDANPCERSEFEQYMDVVGKMKHPNIARLIAFYYAKEEKLLVYDYLPNGSLHTLLHGNRGAGRIPLDWTTRISLVLGAARGLARIHAEYSAAKIPHGNIKSSNVLLDKNGAACISDFGLFLLLNPVHAIAKLGGYKAPEQSEHKKLSQQADVYSFGVLILEVLTGKAPSHQHPSMPRPRTELEEPHLDLPKWVRSLVKDSEEWNAEVFDQELLRYKNIEDELLAMMNVGLVCTELEPEKRPTTLEVVKMIEDIRVEQSPLVEDFDESRNSLSPSIPTTEDGMA
ncbi:leucine-rich repeat receptor-like protein kinase PXC1 [Arachis duranensis]|uniref:Leucine-rich repeat receptor-like protein kinase PXC1 n=1 Tax=Arachis duranensis TaxID=130453 RepID=A0A6P4B8R5_ARADU|nr:leucine-rich repeat receptor-like protein kinase PXC1 [Arachis duranensis]